TAIKDAIRWAKASKGGDAPSSHHHTQATAMQSANIARRKEERKAEAIRLLEGWLGESGASRRKALAKEVSAQQSEGWWLRMSGIVKVEETSSSALDGDDSDSAANPALPTSGDSTSKMPAQMMPLWRDVHNLSESLVQGSALPSSPSNRIKWNPLTMLRK
ncbi:hypothetical protein BGX24_009934, partial [Mortierella sp. AD032]